jgi:two-component system, OmpR family, sensor histidine kinase KdpD
MSRTDAVHSADRLSWLGLPSRLAPRILAVLLALAAATAVVAILEGYAAVPTASSVYLVAVVATAIVAGTFGAVLAALGSAIAYDFLFTDPRHNLVVADPGELLNLLVLLFVAITVGQLAALQRGRAEMAVAREREARALFNVSRALATRESTAAVLPAIASMLTADAAMDRVWFGLGADDASERIVADSAADAAQPPGASYWVLRRMPADVPAEWVRVHGPSARRTGSRGDSTSFRVRIEAGGTTLGSVWAARPRRSELPDRTGTRLLAATADQVGQALAQDRLALAARQAEVARQSDALKTALLESVSHDLRTPLASIRAAAGTLMDPEVQLTWADARASASSIDRQAERLNRLVTNLLDLGRIEGGALRAVTEIIDLDDQVARAVAAIARRPGDPPFEVQLGAPPPVQGDAVLLEEALINVLDNAARHTPPGTRVRVTASSVPEHGVVRISVEDAGPGVPTEALPYLFERFYRGQAPLPGSDGSNGAFADGAGQVRLAPSAPDSTGRIPSRVTSPGGIGIGLAVVRGLIQAMGGQVTARRSELGGLAIDIDLPVGRVPAGLTID